MTIAMERLMAEYNSYLKDAAKRMAEGTSARSIRLNPFEISGILRGAPGAEARAKKLVVEVMEQFLPLYVNAAIFSGERPSSEPKQ